MLSHNPFAELSQMIDPAVMQAYVVLMFLLVLGSTVLDTIHKKSAKYFFQASQKAKKNQTRSVGGGEKVSIAVKTAVNEVMLSSEFCNARRRIAHLLGMYGFVIFLVTTVMLIFAYPTPATPAPASVTGLWHIGALMVCVGGYWFWFFIRVDVAAEGNAWYRIMRADLFILALLATTTFALIWSYMQTSGSALTTLAFALFVISSTTLFGTVLWSKFAHMFFKPAAAFQKRVQEADGSRANLPEPADKPAQFGLGIKREPARHY
ncbi:MAG: adenylyl-sulfate reductase [Arenicellales bacterium]|jgi:hypothetical protein